jgi:hypothetical protein
VLEITAPSCSTVACPFDLRPYATWP